jgi:hypothetical protein
VVDTVTRTLIDSGCAGNEFVAAHLSGEQQKLKNVRRDPRSVISFEPRAANGVQADCLSEANSANSPLSFAPNISGSESHTANADIVTINRCVEANEIREHAGKLRSGYANGFTRPEGTCFFVLAWRGRRFACVPGPLQTDGPALRGSMARQMRWRRRRTVDCAWWAGPNRASG